VTVLLDACSIEIGLDSDNSLKVVYFSLSSKTRAKADLAIVRGIAGGGIGHNAPWSGDAAFFFGEAGHSDRCVTSKVLQGVSELQVSSWTSLKYIGVNERKKRSKSDFWRKEARE
jgi:hypothetical protein